MNLPTFRFCFTKRSLKAMVLKRLAVIFPCDVFFVLFVALISYFPLLLLVFVM